ETHALLQDFSTKATHPSVKLGRLIGLSYLGDWKPLLMHAPTHPAARNAVAHWSRTPPLPVAEWLARRSLVPDLPREDRWALLSLKAEAEQRAGVLVDPSALYPVKSE
ncbi:MAG: hypothetical protein ABW224_10045, partial [Kibdelosporangium sp.]